VRETGILVRVGVELLDQRRGAEGAINDMWKLLGTSAVLDVPSR
jgi:hypothetical protein